MTSLNIFNNIAREWLRGQNHFPPYGAQIPVPEIRSHAGNVMTSVLTPTMRCAAVRSVPLGSVKAPTVGISDTTLVVALVGAHVSQECNGFVH